LCGISDFLFRILTGLLSQPTNEWRFFQNVFVLSRSISMQTAWNSSLATGVNTVDTEHQEIFRQVAMMNQAMIDGKGQAELKKIIDFVDDYIVTHFSHEEKIMNDYRCPVAEANKQAHTKFIANFKTLKQKFDAKGASSSLVLDISSMISDWLINHIKQIDSQLGKCKPDAAKAPALAR
jgi:hemerythrin